MESLLILIPIAVIIVAAALGIFFWAVKSGQFDDLDTEGKRILFDCEPKGSNTSKREYSSSNKTEHESSELRKGSSQADGESSEREH